jgi:protein-S-isoprenylcysteine O-methyltransferase Ste14
VRNHVVRVGIGTVWKSFGWLDVISFGAYLVFLVFAFVAGTRTMLWYAGIGLSIACLFLWLTARWQLGSAFSAGAEARRLVTGGLYSKLRHPIYVFGTVSFLLIVLALQGPPALVTWVVVAAIQVVRARREDRVLEAAFGSEYAAYRDSTWF